MQGSKRASVVTATLHQLGTDEVQVTVIEWSVPRGGRWEGRYVAAEPPNVLGAGSGYLTLGSGTYYGRVDPGPLHGGRFVGGPGEPAPPEAQSAG
jgi:hypothetical protein